jgi:hypothetical protein
MLVIAKERQSTGTFNSLVFYTNSAVDFGFADISDTVSDISMIMSVIVCDREGVLLRCRPWYVSIKTININLSKALTRIFDFPVKRVRNTNNILYLN